MNMSEYSTCKNEQQFKMKYINNVLKKAYPFVFCIETEETIGGFPDVMCLDYNQRAYFFEFKFSTLSGKIKFQPTQPSFYKKYRNLNIYVVAYNKKKDSVVKFPVALFSTKQSEGTFYMNEKAEVQL
jgi:hypothetical protein